MLAEDLQREIDEKDFELKEMAMILDIKETQTSTMNTILLNLREEIENVREENEEISRMKDLEGERHLLQLALYAEKQKEDEEVRDSERVMERDREDERVRALKERPTISSSSSSSSEHTYDSIPLNDCGPKIELKSFRKIERALSEILLWLESKRIFVNKIVPPISCYSSPDCSASEDDPSCRRKRRSDAEKDKIDINNIDQLLQLIERTRGTTELVIDEREHEITRQTSLVKVKELLLEQANLQLMLEGKDGSGTSGVQTPVQVHVSLCA